MAGVKRRPRSPAHIRIPGPTRTTMDRLHRPDRRRCGAWSPRSKVRRPRRFVNPSADRDSPGHGRHSRRDARRWPAQRPGHQRRDRARHESVPDRGHPRCPRNVAVSEPNACRAQPASAFDRGGLGLEVPLGQRSVINQPTCASHPARIPRGGRGLVFAADNLDTVNLCVGSPLGRSFGFSYGQLDTDWAA